jgi:hypothetical protein
VFWRLYSTTVQTTTAWVHVVGTYDGTTLRLYINGVLEASQAASGALGNAAAAKNWAIGKVNAADANNFFNGSIDEVAYYPGKALSAARILAHYQAGSQPSGFAGTSLAIVGAGAVAKGTSLALLGAIAAGGSGDSGSSVLRLAGSGLEGIGDAGTSVLILIGSEQPATTASGVTSLSLQPSQAAASVSDSGSTTFLTLELGTYSPGFSGETVLTLTPTGDDPLIRFEGTTSFRLVGDDGDTSADPSRGGQAVIRMSGEGFAIVADHDPAGAIVPAPPIYVPAGSGLGDPDVRSKYGATQVVADAVHSPYYT